MFGTVLEKLSTWFGQAFLLARVFPILVCLALNGAIAFAGFPALRPRLRAALDAAASGSAVSLVLSLGAIAALAYTLSPFVRLASKALEGDWMLADNANPLSRWLGAHLAAGQLRRSDALGEESHALFLKRVALPDQASVRKRLSLARKIGEALRDVPYPAIIEEAAHEVETLRALRASRQTIPAKGLGSAVEIVEEALRLNCADETKLKATLSAALREQSRRLSLLQRRLVSELVIYAGVVAEDAEARVNEQKSHAFAPGEVAPTAFGNLVAALQSYSLTRYGIDYGFFWPRFRLAIQKNQNLSAALDTAFVQVEFSLVCLILACLSLIAWFAVLADDRAGALPLFIVAVLAQPLTAFWLKAVETSYAAYADIARGTIDLARFELLGALHCPLPPTLQSERRLWQSLARHTELGQNTIDRAFFHTGAAPNS